MTEPKSHAPHSLVRLELHDVVRVVRLDVSDRPYDGTNECARPPAVGDIGRIVHDPTPGATALPLLVECAAAPGQTAWLAYFDPHELELVARGIEVGIPRRRSVGRAVLWICLAVATLTASGIGVCYIDPSSKEVAYPAIGIALGLAVLVLSVLDLGKALVELRAPTRGQRALGFVLRAPRALFGLAVLALTAWTTMRSIDAANQGDPEALKLRIGSVILGIVGLRSLQQAFRRQLRVDANAPSRQAPHR